jgi:hypothetical protein
MLNKDICKQCHDVAGVEFNEIAWKIDVIYCPYDIVGVKRRSGIRDINNQPGKFCPYRLEHIMSKPC